MQGASRQTAKSTQPMFHRQFAHAFIQQTLQSASFLTNSFFFSQRQISSELAQRVMN